MGETHKKCLRLVDKMTNDRRKCVLNSKLMRCLYRFMNDLKQNPGQKRLVAWKKKNSPLSAVKRRKAGNDL